MMFWRRSPLAGESIAVVQNVRTALLLGNL